MKLLILLTAMLAFIGCGLGSDISDPDTKLANIEDEFLVSCEKWTHPSSKDDVIVNNSGSTYNLGQVLSVDLSPVGTTVDPLWSKEELDKNGYTGNNTGWARVNIPENGKYTFWITSKAFITPYLNKEDPVMGGLYMTDCNKQLNKGGYLKAVEFDLKAGETVIQLSNSPAENTVLTVTKAQ